MMSEFLFVVPPGLVEAVAFWQRSSGSPRDKPLEGVREAGEDRESSVAERKGGGELYFPRLSSAFIQPDAEKIKSRRYVSARLRTASESPELSGLPVVCRPCRCPGTPRIGMSRQWNYFLMCCVQT